MSQEQKLLCLHAGGTTVDTEALGLIPTPPATPTWHPIPHRALLDVVRENVTMSGLHIVAEHHGLAREGARYFGMLQVRNGVEDDGYGLVLGLRNSHDMSYPAGLVVGSGVFVCDNLAFSGEIKLARKHTSHIMKDLPRLVQTAFGRLTDYRQLQGRRIAAYRETEISTLEAHDLIVRAIDGKILPVTRVPAVLSEWRTPRHAEFREGDTAWRLFNAFTECLKGIEPNTLARRTMALHGLLDTTCRVLDTTATPVAAAV